MLFYDFNNQTIFSSFVEENIVNMYKNRLLQFLGYHYVHKNL